MRAGLGTGQRLINQRVPCFYQAHFKLKAREGGETALRAVKPILNLKRGKGADVGEAGIDV